MGKRLRFTGEWPPLQLLAEYPNWEYALDEEGEDGQDETTIRPASNQESLDSDVSYTAGTARLADGRSLPAILVLHHDPVTCPSVKIFFNSKDAWKLDLNSHSNTWEPFVETWLPERERSSVVDMKDPKIFPLVVSSALPMQTLGRPLCFTILLGGRNEDRNAQNAGHC